MTCIVAVGGPGGVLIGTDSGVTTGNVLTRIGPKILQRGPVAMAYAGSIRGVQVLEHHVEISSPPRRGDPERFLVRELVQPFRAALGAYTGAQSESPVNLLVVFRRRIWQLGDDFSLLPCPGYGVAGESEDIARGVLEALHDRPVEERVRRALEISAKLCPSVSPEFHYLRV